MNFKHLGLISLVFILVSIFLFYQNGVKIVTDSARYLAYAENLKHGFYVDNHNIWYFSYAVFISVIQLFSPNDLAIVIFQYLLSFLSVITLYKTYFLLFKHRNGALITSLVSILFIEVTAWNSYILCESIYYSFTCFSFYFMAKLYLSEQYIAFKSWAISVSIIVFTILIKPTGIALLATISFVILPYFIKKIRPYYLKPMIIFLGVTALIFLANKMLVTYSIIENYTAGEVVLSITQFSGPSYEPLSVDVPDNIFIPSSNEEPLIRIFLFIVNHPWYWLKLVSVKLFYFLFHIRPYWSLSHNLFCLAILIPLYGLSTITFLRRELDKKILLFCTLFISFHSVIIGMTAVDWDGRFLLPILPIFFIMGVKGGYHLKQMIASL